MPAFVFVSGYFHLKASEKFHNTLKILVIYVIFNQMMMMYSGYIQGIPFRILEPYYSYWYLLALVVWRVVFRFISLHWWVLGLSIFLSLASGYWRDIDNTLAISRIIGFAPFYILGIQASKINFDNFMKKYLRKEVSPINYGYAVLAFCILTIISIVLVKNGSTYDDLIWLPYDNNMGFINRAGIFITSIFMIAVLLKIIPDRKIPLLTEWGKQSLSIFVLHRFILFFSTFLLSFVFIENSFYLIPILMASSFLVTLISGNRWMAGYFNQFFA
ncbi:MAG: hypothetical protein R6V29_14995, partial [Spirochaetia bacterium]